MNWKIGQKSKKITFPRKYFESTYFSELIFFTKKNTLFLFFDPKFGRPKMVKIGYFGENITGRPT